MHCRYRIPEWGAFRRLSRVNVTFPSIIRYLSIPLFLASELLASNSSSNENEAILFEREEWDATTLDSGSYMASLIV
jgi:hypothetical protein